MLHRRRAAPTVLMAGFVALGAGQGPAPATDSISAADLRRDVYRLASDEMSGRLVGTRGNQQAVQFIAERFEQLGLRPPSRDGGFLEPFDLLTVSQGTRQTLSFATPTGDVTAALGRDFYPASFSASGQAEGRLEFVGFGITAPMLGHDDYGDIDVQGRVALVLDHEPGEYDQDSIFDGTDRSEHSRAVRKALEAQRQGAVAVLLVADSHNHVDAPPFDVNLRRTWSTHSRRVPAYELADWVGSVRIPAVWISGDLADRLLDASALSRATLAAQSETRGGLPATTPLDLTVTMETTVERHPTRVHNVVGLLEGTDPELRDEWLIVCAHLDHEGATPSGVFLGADDNASGLAGVLEIAEAFAKAARAGIRPRRSVLFAAWNAEERGLLGAWSYTENPLTPLARTAAVLNMDMIGRHEEVPEDGGTRFRGLRPQTADSNQNAVNLLGYSFSRDLREAAEHANTLIGLNLRFRYDQNRSNLLRRSDHWPFLFHRVPALFIHTGLHPDYHTEDDDPDKLDYDKMERVVSLVHQLSWQLAQDDDRPRLD